jgi:hypothetical protein
MAKAIARELEKINSEDTRHELPCIQDAIVMRMFEILDCQWKIEREMAGSCQSCELSMDQLTRGKTITTTTQRLLTYQCFC